MNGSTPHPMTGHDAFTPGEIAALVETRGVAKAEATTITTFVLALVAAAFIALGAVLSTTVASGSTLGVGPTRWLAGVAFSLGLILVIVAGAELFTGNNLILMSVVAGHVKGGAAPPEPGDRIRRECGRSVLGRHDRDVRRVVAARGRDRRCHRPVDRRGQDPAVFRRRARARDTRERAGLTRGLARDGGTRGVRQGRGDRVPISAFVAPGFEHSIANMFFIPMGLVLRENDAVVAAGGVPANDLADLDLAGMVADPGGIDDRERDRWFRAGWAGVLVPLSADHPSRCRAVTDEASISLHELTKRYGTRRGIDDVSLTVTPGEVFGFLGPNGAGKTTTIRTMLDLLRPTAGRATLLGLDSHDDAVEIHGSVGYLPGDFVAYRRMTGRRYLEFFARVRDVPFATVEALSRRLECDLDPQIATLSHGNAQKLGLIQALMHRPRLLILDEPTQGLDPLIQRVFHELMREIAAEGRSVFLSSHVLPEVERMCDRVGIIGDGRLLGVEDVGDLRAKAIRVLEFHFAAPVPATEFSDLPGVSDLEVHGDTVRCSVRGPVDHVIKAAARHEVVDLRSHEPGLEELFLQYYSAREEAS